MRDPAAFQWWYASEFARCVEVHPDAVPELARLGNVRTRQLPGRSVQYHADDARRLAAEAVREPSKPAA